MASLLPGMMLCAAIGVASFWICRLPPMQSAGISMLVVAMTIGIVLGNTVFGRIAPSCTPGATFAKQTLLRAGIVLYGARLSFHDVAQVGAAGIAIDVLVVVSTLCIALLIGKKVLKLEHDTVMLVGAGSAICGAAAVLATEPVLKARAGQATVAVATVVIFGTLSTFLYPLLYQLGRQWLALPVSVGAFGLYAGSTIHEVAQVVAAARSADAAALDTAVIAKMMRVMLLAPFLAGLALHIAFRDGRVQRDPSATPAQAAVLLRALPWFAFAFVAVVALNSLVPVPAALAARIEQIDTLLIMMAMAALGLTTRLSAFRLAGIRPVLLAAVLFAWLVAGGAAINYLVLKMT